MSYYELEDLPEKDQERAMQQAEKEQLRGQEVAAESEEKEKSSGQEDVHGGEERLPSEITRGRDSVFFPLLEAVRIGLLRECKYDAPSSENSHAFRESMIMLEDKYRLYRIGPEILAGAYFVSPFVVGYAIHIKEHPPGWLKKRTAEEKDKDKIETSSATQFQAPGKSAQQQAAEQTGGN